jgi:transposase
LSLREIAKELRVRYGKVSGWIYPGDTLREMAAKLRAAGLSLRRIGKQLGVSYSTIRLCLNPEAARRVLERSQAKAKERTADTARERTNELRRQKYPAIAEKERARAAANRRRVRPLGSFSDSQVAL